MYNTISYQMLSTHTQRYRGERNIMYMNDEEILNDFVKSRNLKPISRKAYKSSIKLYTEYQIQVSKFSSKDTSAPL